MATEEINKYVQKRYERWLDYASYQCSCVGIADEAIDVLNEVLLDLLQKPEDKLISLLTSKSGQYTELDYFVLRMIKLNATSDTSPYRHKYKAIPTDANISYTQLEIEEHIIEDVFDTPGDIVEKMRIVRNAFDSLLVSDFAKKVFTYRFFCGEKFSEWEGEENEKELFDVYYKIVCMVKEIINGETLFSQFEYSDNMEEELPVKSIVKEVITIASNLQEFDIAQLKSARKGYPTTEQALVYLVCIELGATDDELKKAFSANVAVIHKSAETMRENLLNGGEEIKFYNELYDLLDQE